MADRNTLHLTEALRLELTIKTELALAMRRVSKYWRISTVDNGGYVQLQACGPKDYGACSLQDPKDRADGRPDWRIEFNLNTELMPLPTVGSRPLTIVNYVNKGVGKAGVFVGFMDTEAC